MIIEKKTVFPAIKLCQIPYPLPQEPIRNAKIDSKEQGSIPIRNNAGEVHMEKTQTACEFGDLCAKYRAEKSLFGYTPSVLKSGIQKYGRRAEVDKGLWCIAEMDLFSLLEWDGPILDAYLEEHPGESRTNVRRSARRIRTNLVNRLVAMMSEEVNISAWWIPIKILELYQKWTGNRDNPSSRKHLVDMYSYLTSQRMIRLISDLKSVYLLPPDYAKPEQMTDLVRIFRKISALHPAVYTDLIKIGDVEWNLDLGKYPVSFNHCIKGVAFNIEKGSDHVFYWLHQLCSLEKKHAVAKYRYIKAVWEILYRFIDQHGEYEFVRESISALEFFFKKMTHQEKPIYLYHAILLLVRRYEIDWNLSVPAIDIPIAEVRAHLQRAPCWRKNADG